MYIPIKYPTAPTAPVPPENPRILRSYHTLVVAKLSLYAMLASVAIALVIACQIDQKPCSPEGLAELTQQLQRPYLMSPSEIGYLKGLWRYQKPCDPHHRISRTMAGVDAVLNLDSPPDSIRHLDINSPPEDYWHYFQDDHPIDLMIFELGAFEYDNKAELMADIKKAVIAHYSKTAVEHTGNVDLAFLLSMPPTDFEIERACAYIRALQPQRDLPARIYLTAEKVNMMSETTCRFI